MTLDSEDAESEPQPELSEKVLRLHQALAQADVPHAFGGAMASDYYRVPRATIDIDVGIFLPPEQQDRVLAAVGNAFVLPDPDQLRKEISERDQGKTYWGDTRIDLFFSVSDFHQSAAQRIRRVVYEGAEIPILSAEDIVVFKVLFDRTQDWADIEAISQLQGAALDADYITSWLARLVGEHDPRIERFSSADQRRNDEPR